MSKIYFESLFVSSRTNFELSTTRAVHKSCMVGTHAAIDWKMDLNLRRGLRNECQRTKLDDDGNGLKDCSKKIVFRKRYFLNDWRIDCCLGPPQTRGMIIDNYKLSIAITDRWLHVFVVDIRLFHTRETR